MQRRRPEPRRKLPSLPTVTRANHLHINKLVVVDDAGVLALGKVAKIADRCDAARKLTHRRTATTAERLFDQAGLHGCFTAPQLDCCRP